MQRRPAKAIEYPAGRIHGGALKSRATRILQAEGSGRRPDDGMMAVIGNY
jgi:hypothetical protein